MDHIRSTRVYIPKTTNTNQTKQLTIEMVSSHDHSE